MSSKNYSEEIEPDVHPKHLFKLASTTSAITHLLVKCSSNVPTCANKVATVMAAETLIAIESKNDANVAVSMIKRGIFIPSPIDTAA
ncbi:hypothetical protein SLA2020_508080 [Shorea laevis]